MYLVGERRRALYEDQKDYGVLFEGDYSKAFSEAVYIKEESSHFLYDLTASNCMQVSATIMECGAQNLLESNFFASLRPYIIPNVAQGFVLALDRPKSLSKIE